MNTERYPYATTDDFTRFEFQSVGPNGVIEKIIRYKKIAQFKDGTLLFNLGFGDFVGPGDDYNDLSVSNNEDKSKILATVASTVIAFSEYFKKIAIFATGSTATRTRLYQIGMNAHRNEIEALFHIYGYKFNSWERFQKNVNYKAFVVSKK